MFCISFVVVTVKARIAGLDPRLEQAAMDLYADEWQTFRRITLPLVAPGIMAAALLAFSLSFDDFIITNFNSGEVNTFPKFVWVSSLRGIPAQANVIASAMFFLALVAVADRPGRRRTAEVELRQCLPRTPARRPPPWSTSGTCRTGWTAPPLTRARHSPVVRQPTSPWSAAATPDCGPHCWRRRRDPGRDVVLLEARTAGWAASGRNGGFCSASLTHGLRNGLDRFPAEMATLERLGRENLDGIEAAVRGVRHRLLLRAHR